MEKKKCPPDDPYCEYIEKEEKKKRGVNISRSRFPTRPSVQPSVQEFSGDYRQYIRSRPKAGFWASGIHHDLYGAHGEKNYEHITINKIYKTAKKVLAKYQEWRQLYDDISGLDIEDGVEAGVRRWAINRFIGIQEDTVQSIIDRVLDMSSQFNGSSHANDLSEHLDEINEQLDNILEGDAIDIPINEVPVMERRVVDLEFDLEDSHVPDWDPVEPAEEGAEFGLEELGIDADAAEIGEAAGVGAIEMVRAFASGVADLDIPEFSTVAAVVAGGISLWQLVEGWFSSSNDSPTVSDEHINPRNIRKFHSWKGTDNPRDSMKLYGWGMDESHSYFNIPPPPKITLKPKLNDPYDKEAYWLIMGFVPLLGRNSVGVKRRVGWADPYRRFSGKLIYSDLPDVPAWNAAEYDAWELWQLDMAYDTLLETGVKGNSERETLLNHLIAEGSIHPEDHYGYHNKTKDQLDEDYGKGKWKYAPFNSYYTEGADRHQEFIRDWGNIDWGTAFLLGKGIIRLIQPVAGTIARLHRLHSLKNVEEYLAAVKLAFPNFLYHPGNTEANKTLFDHIFSYELQGESGDFYSTLSWENEDGNTETIIDQDNEFPIVDKRQPHGAVELKGDADD